MIKYCIRFDEVSTYSAKLEYIVQIFNIFLVSKLRHNMWVSYLLLCMTLWQVDAHVEHDAGSSPNAADHYLTGRYKILISISPKRVAQTYLDEPYHRVGILLHQFDKLGWCLQKLCGWSSLLATEMCGGTTTSLTGKKADPLTSWTPCSSPICSLWRLVHRNLISPIWRAMGFHQKPYSWSQENVQAPGRT